MNGLFLFFVLCIEKNEYSNIKKSSREIPELSKVVNHSHGWEVEEDEERLNSNLEVLSDELDIGVRSGLVDASFSAKYSKFLESMVKTDFSYRDKWFYEEGENGSERLVREEFSKGEKWFYERDEDENVRLDRKEFSNGDKWFYEGEYGSERLVRIECSNRDKEFYEGESGSERLIRKEFSNGDKWFYKGDFYEGD